jgi:hypothetical protein
MAPATACLIGLFRPYKDGRFVPGGRASVHKALGTCGLSTTDFADSVQFDNILGERQQSGHNAERHATKVLIEACHNHIYAAIGETLTQGNDGFIEELNLLNSHHMDSWV